MRREKITDRVRTAAHVGGHRWRRLVVRLVDNPRWETVQASRRRRAA
jgi:hypothetical protein